MAGWDRHHIPESEEPVLDLKRVHIVFSPETLEGEVTTRAMTYRDQPKHTQLCFHKLIIQHIIITSKQSVEKSQPVLRHIVINDQSIHNC